MGASTRSKKNPKVEPVVEKSRKSSTANHKKSTLNKCKNVVFLNKKNNKKCNNKKKTQKRKKFSLEDLQQAVEAVDKGSTLREAAQTYGVSPATILRRRKNPEKVNDRTGPATIFSDEEEQEIVQWIVYRAERGYPVTKSQLLDSVQSYVQGLKKETPFKDSRPGRHWFEGFRKRHPEISSRTAQTLIAPRALVTEEDLREWFTEIESYLRGKDLIHIDPTRIFNCDESSIQLCPKSEKVLTRKGSRTVYKVVEEGERECLSTLFMYSAAGVRAPPMILYKYTEKLPERIVKNCPASIGIGMSESGWENSETFFEYVTRIFYPWLIEKEIEFPIIVYVDGHASHVTVPLVSFCREHKIELIALYPHATHIIQPLDIAFFHPFKDVWRKTVLLWKAKNNNKRLTTEFFAQVLKLALDSFKEESNVVKSGFRASGLVPFDPEAVDFNVLQKRKKKNSSLAKKKVQSVEQPVKDASDERSTQLLQSFEENLSVDLLQQFEDAALTGVWTGEVENQGLFDYWLRIKTTTLGINLY